MRLLTEEVLNMLDGDIQLAPSEIWKGLYPDTAYDKTAATRLEAIMQDLIDAKTVQRIKRFNSTRYQRA